jgi:hypothetical protein
VPYVPTAPERRRRARAIDRASFTEAERIGWLTAFATVLVVDAIVLWRPSFVGLVGSLGALALLYWRLRGGHVRSGGEDRDLHGVGLMSREQRAFTALMLRHVFSGENPMRGKVDHDPIGEWARRTAAQRAGQVGVAPSEDASA